jgi:hypothetical protein
MLMRILVSLSTAAGLLWSIGCGLCANDVVSEVRSPDGKLRVVVFRRDCGATTDFTLHVSVLGAAQPLSNDEGNVFRALNDGKTPPIEVKVAWQDSRHLLVRFPARAKPFRQYPTEGAIRVFYESFAQ